jgi:serine/threonine protein kinase/TolB-like protein/Tfp pilus assembly protein PilF
MFRTRSWGKVRVKIALSVSQMARMSRLLDDALVLDPAGRRHWLAQLPGEHRDLAPALERALLQKSPVEANALLDTLPRIGTGRAPASPNLAPGQRIGPYQLVRRLGTGGMAEVWLAQRADGAYQRGVALKLPMLSIHRRDLALRFAHERDILAGLEHIHIARLYDAGLSPEGLPYLAMEYVPGEPLTAWCDKRRLGISERISLFLQVLDAVQYAHARQVIHCDIKPSNVLVTESGQVRLLDFGVAKLLADENSTQTQLTQIFERALTPDYASPEHLRGDPVDALSDIYSLGVLLYELLSGTRPSRHEMETPQNLLVRAPTNMRIQRPSVRLAPGSEEVRATTHTKLSRSLRGDLDAIALKALARAQQDRYATARALADDLMHYLRGEPVQAQPGRLLYRAEKFVMRHRGHTASALGAAAVVLAGVGLALRYQPLPVPGDGIASTVPVSDKSIAVLPFVDMSEKKDQEYFSDGLSEELLNLLSKVPGLRVAARTSAFSFKGKADDIPTIARKLMVANVLEGSVRKSGDKLRITAQLVRADNGYQLWSQTYDRKLDDVFKIQGEIAYSVAQALKASLLEGTTLMPSGTKSTDAYTLYLQARSLLVRGGDSGDWERIAAVLKRVLALEPTFAPAWAWYSHARSEQAMRGYLPASEGYEEGRQAAHKAIALDPKLPEAHAALAKVQMLYDWDWARAQSQIRESLNLDPGNWAALQWAGILAEELGNFDDAAEQLKKASAIDPLSSYSIARLARTYYKAGKLPEAQIAYVRAVALKSPSDHYIPTMGGVLFLEMGDFKQALAIFDRAAEEETRLSGRALTYFALGRRADADSALGEYKRKFAAVRPYQIAALYAYRGENDNAFAWLDRAYRQRDFSLADVKGDPVFKKLWPDGRFKQFLRRMKFPD